MVWLWSAPQSMGVSDNLGKARLAAAGYMEIGGTAVVEPAWYVDEISPVPNGYEPACGTRYAGVRRPSGRVSWRRLPPAEDARVAA
jgi:hypothetical protein